MAAQHAVKSDDGVGAGIFMTYNESTSLVYLVTARAEVAMRVKSLDAALAFMRTAMGLPASAPLTICVHEIAVLDNEKVEGYDPAATQAFCDRCFFVRRRVGVVCPASTKAALFLSSFNQLSLIGRIWNWQSNGVLSQTTKMRDTVAVRDPIPLGGNWGEEKFLRGWGQKYRGKKMGPPETTCSPHKSRKIFEGMGTKI